MEKADLALDNAKRLYKEAYDAGDASAMADAQALMSKATLEKSQLESFKPRKVEEDEKKYDSIKTEKRRNFLKLSQTKKHWTGLIRTLGGSVLRKTLV